MTGLGDQFTIPDIKEPTIIDHQLETMRVVS